MSEKKYALLPADDAVQNWFEENIDKECSASSAIYKFRLWLESMQSTQPGPVWVNAERTLPAPRTYNAKKDGKPFVLKFMEADKRMPKEYWKGVEWLCESPAEQPVAWISAETKPEHNVGVLVFIPGEDNHITSGMWDISNEWVLLDEYRTPEEEVTHWMPLPAFPEGYERDVISDEWVSTLKAIAKEELAKRPKAAEQPVREVAIAFTEWLNSNFVSIENKDGEAVYVEYSPQEYEKKQQFKIAQLWEVYKKENPAEWSGEKETKEAIVMHNNSDAFHHWVSDIKGYPFTLLGHSTGVLLPPGITLEMFESEWEAYEKANNPAKKESKNG